MKNSTVTPDMFTRVNSDVNGNPRYVIHFLNFITDSDTEKIKEDFSIYLERNPFELTSLEYANAVNKARQIGGKKYHTKRYGGGIVFQSFNIQHTCNRINELLAGN